ncbi:hypothetical protein GBSOP10_105418 [Armatimonadetes bacterium GBS]|jgi:hypothetical protein|nr:MAG: hypothetical protein KatS3mg021_1294 [Fimbriimonadales bacterium]CUU08235.1 hypothetical protein GBSOP10_105418 [Armatimonadetes bacterium GBS]CUU38822.1 hypothetical protein GXSOP10_14518 [Armatimonadetes bacterium GXS]
MAEGRPVSRRWRMHRREEIKPDGRRIYYYTFQPEADSGMLINPNSTKEVHNRCECANASCDSDDTDA